MYNLLQTFVSVMPVGNDLLDHDTTTFRSFFSCQIQEIVTVSIVAVVVVVTFAYLLSPITVCMHLPGSRITHVEL